MFPLLRTSQDEDNESVKAHSKAEGIELPSINDLSILKAVAKEFDKSGIFAFQGVKRKLGLHQETLSRSLRRLERDGFVERLGNSYRLSEKGRSLLSSELSVLQDFSAHGDVQYSDSAYSVPLLRAVLPPDANLSEVLSALEHKWFGNLRWFGSSRGKDAGSSRLVWVTEDGKLKITATITSDSILIECFPSTSQNMAEGIRAAYQLFDHLYKALRGLISLEPSSLGKAS